MYLNKKLIVFILFCLSFCQWGKADGADKLLIPALRANLEKLSAELINNHQLPTEYSPALFSDEALLKIMEYSKIQSGWLPVDEKNPFTQSLFHFVNSCVINAKQRQISTQNFTVDHIDEVAQSYFGKTREEMEPGYFAKRLEGLAERMDHDVLGMPHIKQHLVRETIKIEGDTHQNDRPRLRFLLVGSRGMGQAILAKSYAKHLGLKNVVEIDMKQFSEATPHNIQNGFYPQLIAPLQKDPFTLFVFRDVEMAAAPFQLQLAQFLVSGSLYGNINNSAFKLDTTRASAILTTSAGQHNVYRLAFGGKFGFLPQTLSHRTNMELLESEEGRLRLDMEDGGLSERILAACKVLAIFPPRTEKEFEQVVSFNITRVLQELSERHKVDYTMLDQEEVLKALKAKFLQRTQESGYGAVIETLEDRIRTEIAKLRLTPGALPVKGCAFSIALDF
jgi:ATP-dependent Clp protease ATP-binding subunit ClpA